MLFEVCVYDVNVRTRYEIVTNVRGHYKTINGNNGSVMSTNSNNHKLSGNTVSISSKHHQQQQQSNSVGISGQPQQQIQHSVPPRYQPPPQPPGGILKNLPSSKTVSVAHYTTTAGAEPSNVPHLNIKYPPDVPKLAPVYIPESVRAGIASKGAPPRPALSQRHSTGHTLQHQQPPQLQPHHRSAISAEEEQLLRLQQLQQQEMLKFVRKPEAEPPSAVAGQPQPAQSVTRLSADQNRHFQVNCLSKILRIDSICTYIYNIEIISVTERTFFYIHM